MSSSNDDNVNGNENDEDNDKDDGDDGGDDNDDDAERTICSSSSGGCGVGALGGSSSHSSVKEPFSPGRTAAASPA